MPVRGRGNCERDAEGQARAQSGECEGELERKDWCGKGATAVGRRPWVGGQRGWGTWGEEGGQRGGVGKGEKGGNGEVGGGGR